MKRTPVGTWAFWLHRISGVGIALFLLLHTLDTMLILWGPEAYNSVMGFLNQPMIKLFELVLVGAVVYHAVNGLRLILLDLWPILCTFHRTLFWTGVGVMVLLILPVVVSTLRSLP